MYWRVRYGSEMWTSGENYSYGILLLEMITKKHLLTKCLRQTLILITLGGLPLSQRVMEIVDRILLTKKIHGSEVVEILISLIKVGLTCSTESQKDRMNINTALLELHLVKNNILKGNSWRSYAIFCKFFLSWFWTFSFCLILVVILHGLILQGQHGYLDIVNKLWFQARDRHTSTRKLAKSQFDKSG